MTITAYIYSPGHVVYIFRCKVEGLYLRVASFESAEKGSKGTVNEMQTRHRDL